MRRSCANRIVFGCILLVGLLTGCIRPDATPTETSPESVFTPPPGTSDQTIVPTVSSVDGTPDAVATPPGPGADGVSTDFTEADLIIIQGYMQNTVGRPITSGTLAVWNILPFRAVEIVIGISYTNPSGLSCVGAVMASRDASGNLNVFTGDARCATEPGAQAVAGSWLLVSLSTGDVLTATAAQVFNPSTSVLVAIVTYGDGAAVQTDVESNRVLTLRTDFLTATKVQFINQIGNTEAEAFILP